MASCVRNTRTKNYQNVIIDFQVTVENVGNVFLRHSVHWTTALFNVYLCTIMMIDDNELSKVFLMAQHKAVG